MFERNLPTFLRACATAGPACATGDCHDDAH